jgi:hypothetical protein
MKPENLRLSADHGWRSQPNHKILILDSGAVRLEYPETWIVEGADDCVKIHDRCPPDDECVLGVSYHRWPVAGEALAVTGLVRDALDNDERSFSRRDSVVAEVRADMSLAWGQGRFIDARVDREACARLALARKDEIQALLTFDFWLSDLARCHALWTAFLASLRLAEWVADPRQGPAPS